MLSGCIVFFLYLNFIQAKNSIYISQSTDINQYAMPEKTYQRLTIINTKMAPGIATKRNYCRHEQGKISKKQFQKAEEKVSEQLLVYNKLIRMCRTPA